MKKKIVGIFVSMLMIVGILLPMASTMNFEEIKTVEKNVVSDECHCSSSSDTQGFVTPVEEWSWVNTNPVWSQYQNVVNAPIVAELDGNPANGAEIIFSTWSIDPGIGILRAIHGKDGSSYFDVLNSAYRVCPLSTPAVGDIDQDGSPEIILLEEIKGGVYISTHLLAFEKDGTFECTSTPTRMLTIGCPAIADLDGDKIPEIVVGTQVFKYNKISNLLELRATGSGSSAYNNSIVANIDLLGTPEIIDGNTVYNYDPLSPTPTRLTVKYHNSDLLAGYNAVGDFDNDIFPEIVLVTTNHEIYLLNHDLTIKWGKNLQEDLGGAPTIADYNGDGFPEIGVATKAQYYVFDRTGAILWQKPIIDTVSGATSSTVCDLNCDGIQDVIFADELAITIFDGRNGDIEWKTNNTSVTVNDLPVVADVDNDNHAEFVVPCNYGNNPVPQYYYGIRVFGDLNNNWAKARKIWNQQSYHITNVNDDSTIPSPETNSWWKYNNYRVQKISCCCFDVFFPAFSFGRIRANIVETCNRSLDPLNYKIEVTWNSPTTLEWKDSQGWHNTPPTWTGVIAINALATEPIFSGRIRGEGEILITITVDNCLPVLHKADLGGSGPFRLGRNFVIY
jgi:hypothetical protein